MAMIIHVHIYSNSDTFCFILYICCSPVGGLGAICLVFQVIGRGLAASTDWFSREIQISVA